MNPILERLVKAAATAGYELLEADKAHLENVAHGFTDDALNKAVTAFSGNLPSGGMKNLEWGPIKGALLASQPDLDAIANEKIDALFDAIDAALKNAAK
jgi:hypothetical protein